MRLVGKTREDIDRTPIDFFSIGHVIFGTITYLICNVIIYALGFHELYREYSFAAAFIVFWCWEVVENTVLKNTRLKFNGRKDDLFNSLADQFFGMMGATIDVLLEVFLNDNFYYMCWITIISLALFVGYKIWRKKVLMNVERETQQ